MIYFLCLFKTFIYLFIYLFISFLAALGLSCSTQDLRCMILDLPLWRTGFSLVEAPGLGSHSAQA